MELRLEQVLLSFLSFLVVYITKKVLELDKSVEIIKRELEIFKEIVCKEMEKEKKSEK